MAARLTSPLIMGRTKSSALMAMGSVWIPQLIDGWARANGSFLRLEGSGGEQEVKEKGRGTCLGVV